ncbi:MAG: sigma 54-interacting transcriptional regulator [Deltaproteobacteria bacterium]|nr:sigma 54-interacting transcriptional regulator [Deltaproteobacteria bacterium]
MKAAGSEFPARYEPLERLGKGGGGEVWRAQDRVTGQVVALKLLRDGADEIEMQALVREATALSGIEGLGVPQVLSFGRLPKSGRAFMVRDMVEGKSLTDLLAQGGDGRDCLSAVAQAADLVTRLHRALLLHGDIKPANIIVGTDGTATLVDLGLAAHWQEGGAKPQGLTPRYAAPELFCGEPLTPQAEVYALGATAGEVLRDAMSTGYESVREAVKVVVERATAEVPAERYPSADEFVEALRHAAGLETEPIGAGARVWSIVGTDGVSADLLAQVEGLEAGAGLVVSGPYGAGRSTLLRRLAWSLGVTGSAVGLIEGGDRADLDVALDVALANRDPEDVVLIVDDADLRSAEDLDKLDQQRAAGATLIVALSSDGDAAKLPGATFALFQVPSLAEQDAADLVRRMIPSLSESLVEHIVARSGRLPGTLRDIVDQLEGDAVVSVKDVERRLDTVAVPPGVRIDSAEIHRLLDRGRFDHAAEYLEAYRQDGSVTIALARAKLATGRGDARTALTELRRVEADLEDEGEELAVWHVQKARAHLRAGDYEDAERHANVALTRLGGSLLGEMAAGELPKGDDGAELGSLVADALAVCGLTQSLSARHDEAARTLRRSVDVARASSDLRMLAVALGSLAFALQRTDKLDEAQAANEEALVLAEKAGDAGHVATTRLNLAGISRIRGDLAGAIVHLEAAVDMGRRSGRQATVRQALLNLANLDLYLGRQARARGSIDALVEERSSLAASTQAQLLALEAESTAFAGDLPTAQDKCLECAEAYLALGRPVDAAEARLERVRFAVRGAAPEPAELQEDLFQAEALLADSGAHRPLLLVARGLVARLAGDGEQARLAFGEAIEAARDGGQREWLWRAHEARSAVRAAAGDDAGVAEDRREALLVLEDIASHLPRDLREVYWNDPRRRALRTVPEPTLQPSSITRAAADVAIQAEAPTQLGNPVREERLSRLLEINREIAGVYDLDRLLERVTDHALALLYAERGFVLLRSRSGEDHLSVHAVRDRHGDDPHARFSQSIAERVVESGEAFVAADAGHDERVSDYVSVHALMLKSVACVPIRTRSGVIGALYLETRMRPGAMFRDELPTLSALADQVAIAIETARLVSENQERARELEAANAELAAAHAKLEQLLGRRTEQLQSTRRDLRSAREVLQGHFGYQGIVGTAKAMRRVYAIVERVKEADVPVLITGDSGTGKEVIARAIHNAGPRTKQKMVGVNCGAIPEHLLESELFGHVRGAFTGADRDNKGLFRDLDKGTILLDEIGEMSPKMQAGLLRVLQEKVVRPVGGTDEEPVNTRVIAATHRDLSEMVRQGTFREDLFYRLNVIEIKVPPLRERLEDVPLLIDHFLRLFAARYNREKRTVSRDALKRLMAFSWPGNVRQLENVLLNAWVLSDGAELQPQDFELPEDRATRVTPELRAQPTSLDAAKEEERERIVEALNATSWNRAKAAKLIGMPRRTFYRRLQKYGIQ